MTVPRERRGGPGSTAPGSSKSPRSGIPSPRSRTLHGSASGTDAGAAVDAAVLVDLDAGTTFTVAEPTAGTPTPHDGRSSRPCDSQRFEPVQPLLTESLCGDGPADDLPVIERMAAAPRGSPTAHARPIASTAASLDATALSSSGIPARA